MKVSIARTSNIQIIIRFLKQSQLSSLKLRLFQRYVYLIVNGSLFRNRIYRNVDK